MSPQPIDRTLYRVSVQGCNGSRRRRFALDLSKRRHYALYRQQRFTVRLRSA